MMLTAPNPQIKLYDIVHDNKLIANPYTGGSWHQRGRAIDMSLIDNATGLELEMPTPMHTFDDTIPRRVTAAIRGQRRRAKTWIT